MYRLVGCYIFDDGKPGMIEDAGSHKNLQDAVEHAERVVKNNSVCYIDIKEIETDKIVKKVKKEIS